MLIGPVTVPATVRNRIALDPSAAPKSARMVYVQSIAYGGTGCPQGTVGQTISDDRSGARIVRHGRYLVFQLAEVAVPRSLVAAILRRVDRLRGPPMVAA